MEEVKVWVLKGAHAESLESATHMNTEESLEETLVKNPQLLMDNLTLVGRQTPTQGGEALDLLGVDSEGRLVVFELKRGTLTREAVTQVVDYTSYLASLDLNALYRSHRREIGKQRNTKD